MCHFRAGGNPDGGMGSGFRLEGRNDMPYLVAGLIIGPLLPLHRHVILTRR